MKYSKRYKALVGGLVLGVVLCVMTPLNTMISKKSISSKRGHAIQTANQERYKSNSVWVKTSDGVVMELPQWQIDQMKVLQVLFVHQKGGNSKDNPVNAAMVTGNQLEVLKKALELAGDSQEFKLFCGNLTQDERKSLINGASVLEAQGLSSLIMTIIFPKEIQAQMGASMLQPAAIIASVIEYLKENQRKILEGHPQQVWCVAYSPDGNYIVSGSVGGALILWDRKTGEQVKILKGHKGRVTCVAYSPDGQFIVSGSDDKNLILWNGKTGEQIKILKGHTAAVRCVAYSSDGNYIVSGSVDETLIVWDGNTGKQIRVFKGHEAAVGCVAYSPEGSLIGSGLDDKSLIVWRLIDDQTLDYIATKLNIAQARLLYRLYLAQINNVPVVLDKEDADYQLFKTLPANVQQVIQGFFPFEESSIFVEKAVQEKMNEYRSSLNKIATTVAEKIKTLNVLMQDFDKNSVEYKACERLLRELEQEAVFEA